MWNYHIWVSLALTSENNWKHSYKPITPKSSSPLIFCNTNTIGNFLKQRTICNSDLSSNIVYLFTCLSCQAKYVGSTSRWLRDRIFEHRGRSTRTGRPLSHPSFSSVREHSQQHSHPFSSTDFSILASYSSRLDPVLAESLLIQRMKPNLNNTTTATTLFTH